MTKVKSKCYFFFFCMDSTFEEKVKSGGIIISFYMLNKDTLW